MTGAADNPQPMPGDALALMASSMQQDYGYESLWIFPNLIVAPVPNMTFVIVLYPDAPGVTVERVAFYFNGDEAMAAEHADGRAAAAAAILQVNNEDIAIVESCQRGRRSKPFVGGVFMTKQEATSIQVQLIVAGRLLEQSGDAVDLATLPVEEIHHDRRRERATNGRPWSSSSERSHPARATRRVRLPDEPVPHQTSTIRAGRLSSESRWRMSSASEVTTVTSS
ncbi:MAG: hypothetical protein M3337_08305 [Actinomycetota bacterium]|nr:hypothetical protein [Actinomycetota bacterium]